MCLKFHAKHELICHRLLIESIMPVIYGHGRVVKHEIKSLSKSTDLLFDAYVEHLSINGVCWSLMFKVRLVDEDTADSKQNLIG
jgi:hypothetical protein